MVVVVFCYSLLHTYYIILGNDVVAMDVVDQLLFCVLSFFSQNEKSAL